MINNLHLTLKILCIKTIILPLIIQRCTRRKFLLLGNTYSLLHTPRTLRFTLIVFYTFMSHTDTTCDTRRRSRYIVIVLLMIQPNDTHIQTDTRRKNSLKLRPPQVSHRTQSNRDNFCDCFIST